MKNHFLFSLGVLCFLIACACFALLPRGSRVVEKEAVLPTMQFTGTLSKERFSGEGKLDFSINGETASYEGNFREGLPEGEGTLTTSDATIQGIWKQGELQTGARILFPNRGAYQQDAQGNWKAVEK